MTGTSLSSSDKGVFQSSGLDSPSLTGVIFWSISSIFFCKMLRSVAWLGDSGGGGGGGDLVRFVWTGGLGLTLVCRGGSTGACGGLGLRDGGVIWGIFLGGSGGGR